MIMDLQPQTNEHEAVELQTIERKPIEPTAVESQALERESIKVKTIKAQTLVREKVESQEDEPETLEHEAVELQTIERKPIGSTAVESQALARESIEVKTIKAQTLVREKVESKEDEPETLEHEAVELQTIERKPIGSTAVESQALERESIEVKTIKAQKLVREKVESQEDGPETLEQQAVEPEEVELHEVSPQTVAPQYSLNRDRISSPVLFSGHPHLVLWRHPILTLFYFFKELFVNVQDIFWTVLQYRRTLQAITTVLFIGFYLNCTRPICPTLVWIQKKSVWCLYWFSLGMLSSVGLGNGIHTFVLYLGPYIASVTIAANECGYLNFGEDNYTGVINCPLKPDPRWAATLWNIMCKVRLESYMWGLGTAVGELPPYFMGRGARISGQDEEIDGLREFDELQRRKVECPESLTRLDTIKLIVRDLVMKAGFWGILICASVPNPFFDLAGITCGILFVPFWTFFGATLLGKTFIKTTVQQVFIIISFNKDFLAGVAEILSEIPIVGQRLQMHLSQYVAQQKEIFQKDSRDDNSSRGWFSIGYHLFGIFSFLYCFTCFINNYAQRYYRRIKREELKINE